MSERMLRAEEPKLVVGVLAFLLLTLAVVAPYGGTSGGNPTEGGM